MEKRKLGATGLNVSAICLGTMTWGSQNVEAEGHEQMDFAVSQNINFFDTAELYAVPPNPETYGRTEEIIGSWFKNRGGRDKIILASKIAGPGLPWIHEGKDINKETLPFALENSLKRLQTDYIDLYQLHWPNRGHYHFGQHWNYLPTQVDPQKTKDDVFETIETLNGFIKAGKIRHYGLSNETAWGMMQFANIADKHNLPRPVSIQNEYNLTCRIFEPDLSEIALHEKIGLLAYSPLTTGAISGKYLNGQVPPGTRRSLAQRHNHRSGPIFDAAVNGYIDVAKKHGLDVCQMALAFCLARPFMTSVIIGATKMDQLKTDIAAYDIKLSNEVLADIETVRRQYPVPY